MRVLILLLLFFVNTTVWAEETRGIGFPTVAAALEALKARTDVNISIQGGWTIADDRLADTIWSFTPSDHPAYPAAVKRAIVSKDGGLYVNMTALCQASKAACDKLITDFKELNEKMIQSIRKESAQATPESEIQVQRLGDDAFRLTLKSFRSRTVDAGQEELLAKAREVCGGKSARYGKYTFETDEAISPTAAEKRPFMIRQDIICGGTESSPAPTSANKDPQWRPTTSQEQLVERQTLAYFSAKDGKKYQAAYALLSPAQKEIISYERWTSMREEFNAKAGEVLSRKIKKVTWYKDPPRAAPGVYAAADFVSQFANVDLHCGFIAWQEQPDGSFLLVREEENFIDNNVKKKLKPGEFEKVRAQFGC